jgi:hypothetical protein
MNPEKQVPSALEQEVLSAIKGSSMDNLCSVTEGPAMHIVGPSFTKEYNPKEGVEHDVQKGEVYATFNTIAASSGVHSTYIFNRQEDGSLKKTHSILHTKN